MRISYFKKIFLMLLCMSINTGCTAIQPVRDESSAVTITGVQHLGNDFSIREFYVDGYSGGNVGRGGGGGSYACCVMMPEKWHNGLTVLVKWTVSDWRNADLNAIANEDYSTIKIEGSYIATVPVEEYSELGNLHVHFFANEKVRVVSSMFGLFRGGYPISRDVSEEKKATQGARVPSLNNADVASRAKGK